MKARIKICNSNAVGVSSFEEFNSIKELKNYLNHCLYYSGEVYLNVPSLSNYIKYSETKDVASLVREVNYFNDDYLEIVPTFEEVEL